MGNNAPEAPSSIPGHGSAAWPGLWGGGEKGDSGGEGFFGGSGGQAVLWIRTPRNSEKKKKNLVKSCISLPSGNEYIGSRLPRRSLGWGLPHKTPPRLPEPPKKRGAEPTPGSGGPGGRRGLRRRGAGCSLLGLLGGNLGFLGHHGADPSLPSRGFFFGGGDYFFRELQSPLAPRRRGEDLGAGLSAHAASSGTKPALRRGKQQRT